MPFELPVKTFDANGYARELVSKFNRNEELQLLNYIESYNDFWQLGVISKDDMQASLDVLGSVAIGMMVAAAEWIAIIKSKYGANWDTQYDKYLSCPYSYIIDGDGRFVLGDLNEAWL
jgi:hypothetical protein